MTSIKVIHAAIAAISLMGLFSAKTGEAHSRSGPSTSQIVTGQVSEVEGEFRIAKNARGEEVLKLVDKSYVVITGTGQEIHLKLTSGTKVPARANPGDRIEAKISNGGETLSVTRIE